MKTVRLLSAEMFNTPGFMRWLMAAYAGGDKKVAIEALVNGFDLSKIEAVHLLTGEIPYRVVGDMVEFDSPHRGD